MALTVNLKTSLLDALDRAELVPDPVAVKKVTGLLNDLEADQKAYEKQVKPLKELTERPAEKVDLHTSSLGAVQKKLRTFSKRWQDKEEAMMQLGVLEAWHTAHFVDGLKETSAILKELYTAQAAKMAELEVNYENKSNAAELDQIHSIIAGNLDKLRTKNNNLLFKVGTVLTEGYPGIPASVVVNESIVDEAGQLVTKEATYAVGVPLTVPRKNAQARLKAAVDDSKASDALADSYMAAHNGTTQEVK